MERHYTDNLILKYLYRETSLTQTLELENSIEHNPETRSAYLRLRKAYRDLPKVVFFPKEETVSNILTYSHQAPALDCQY